MSKKNQNRASASAADCAACKPMEHNAKYVLMGQDAELQARISGASVGDAAWLADDVVTAAVLASMANAVPQPVLTTLVGANAGLSAKDFIRRLLSVPGAEYTLEALCDATGKSKVNVTTALSDLRNPKYAGKAGTFATVGLKKADGKTYYTAA